MTDGPDAGKELESSASTLRIGSAEGNELRLSDRAISRFHLELRMQNGEYVIVDAGSTNGTFMGSLRVEKAVIRERTEIHIGDSSLLFEPIDSELRVEPSGASRCDELVGQCVQMREIYTVIERVAPTDLTILVAGETGTGKELVARAIHKKSRRASSPFVTLDCSALPPTLIESALFGHERGAFTGADQAYAGVFERAHGGTLFLDELGELPIELQAKLLRVLERGEIQRLRGDKMIRVDVRVVGATNRDLHAMVQAGSFRGDLYYRLAVIRIELPPLRRRGRDVRLIVDEFFARYADELAATGVRARRVGPGAMAVLQKYPFPGNVRELVNILRRASVFAEGEELTAADLPAEVTGVDARSSEEPVEVPTPRVDGSLPFKDAKAKVLDAFERQYLQDLLERHGQNLSRAARNAGIDRRHLYRLLEKYEITTHERWSDESSSF